MLHLFKKESNANGAGNALDEYSNKVFRLVVLIVPVFFLCGNGAMTILHYLGWYPELHEFAMWISNSIDISYLIIAIILVKVSYGPDGTLIPKRLYIAKWILMGMVVLQWNMNSYICPFADFWAYAPLFVIVEAFFFDIRFVARTTILILISMTISWFLNGENLLPAHNEYYLLNIVFRIIGTAFTLLCVNIITWFGKVFIIEAVTTRKREAEMKEISSEYEREAQMKSDFLANMSHEIRTPMNAVIGMAEIAMREDLSPAARDCLTQIQKSGRNLLNIINDILDYSKIDSGKMEIIPEKYNPSSELNDVSNVLITRVGEKDIELYVHVDKEIPQTLYGDIMRIRQILINFTNNAIKFTNQGSIGVYVTWEKTEDDDTIMLTTHVKDTGIGIKEEDMSKLFVSFQQVDSRRNRSVEGTGLGLAISQRLVEAMGGTVGVNSVYGEGSDFWFSIPQKIIDPTPDLVIKEIEKKRVIFMEKEPKRIRVFMDEMDCFGMERICISDSDAYSPVEGRRDYILYEHKRYKDQVRKIMEVYPEVIGLAFVDFNASFKPDIPNLYTLRRPISTQKFVKLLNDNNEDEQIIESKSFVINFTAPSAKILVVDDNEINIKIVEGLLAPMQMQLDSALSGPESIKKVRENEYDIVLMDHMMPDMDGVDATKIIRKDIKNEEELVIIALSANALEEAKNMFLEAGMNDFVAKPIEIQEMVSKIKKWLPDEKIVKGSAGNADKEVSTDPLMNFDLLESVHAARALGSVQLFRDIVGEYYRFGHDKYEGIKEAYEREDWKDYTIKVHALKSTSRQIGATKISDMAAALEKAGDAGNIEFIRDNGENLLIEYQELLDRLGPFFPETSQEDNDAPELSPEQEKEILNRAKEACDLMDIVAMEEVRKELMSYAWPKEKAELFKKLCKSMDEMDTDACIATIKQIEELSS